MYNIRFEVITAIVFLLITVGFLDRKRLKIKTNSTFLHIIAISLLGTVLDCTTGVINDVNINMPVIWKYVLNLLFFVIHLIVAYSYSLYILAATRKMNIKWKYKIVQLTPLFIGEIFVILSPFLHTVFYFDKNGQYCHGSFYFVIPTVAFLYVVISTVIAIIFSNNLNRTEKRTIEAFGACVLICITIEILFLSNVLLVYYGIAIAMFICFITLQSPGTYIDGTTGLFRLNGFEEVIKERMTYGHATSCLIIRVRNYGIMSEIYDDERLARVQKMIADTLESTAKKVTFYHLSSSTFAAVMEDDESVEILYEGLKIVMPQTWIVNGEEILHEYSYYIINSITDCDNIDNFLELCEYARSDHEGHHKAGELIRLKTDALEEYRRYHSVARIIEKTIADNSIEIYFQPIYSIEKDKISSLEVLSRLKDENGKFINPEYFIHVAEESHNIIQLGEQIYRKACIFADKNKVFDLGIEDININLSPLQCYYEGLTDDLVRIADEYNIPMSRMHLEITESAMMDKKNVVNTLLKIRSSGAKVALDDFGTGYSSLVSIVNLPINFVKIDKSLVWSYSDGKNKFLDELIPMIQSEGKKIIAEGIETQEHIDIFKRLNGDFLQGYFYSKPVPEEEFIRYVKKTNGYR